MAKDYYNILGVDKSASGDEIKKSYRKMAMKHHPDKNPNDKNSEEKFKDISEAYSILSDDTKKSNYDQFGDPEGRMHQGFDMNDFMRNFNMGGNPFGQNPFGQNPFGQNPFGGHSRQIKRGSDLRVKIDIGIRDVNTGYEKNIKYSRKVKCDDCGGFGGEQTKCRKCNGIGKLQINKNVGFATISTTVDCDECRGSGHIIKKPCNICNGHGVVDRETELNVKLPMGIEDSDRFQANGNGNMAERAGDNGISGNLIIDINIINDTLLVRDGNNLIYNLELPFTTLMLGGESKIPTLDKDVKIKIPPYTKPDEIKRLRNKGLSNQRGHKGDILVIIQINVPKKLTPKEKKLLKELSNLENFNSWNE